MVETISRILVPVDFSAHSDRATQYGWWLAGRVGAAVELMHVVENPFMSGAWNTEVYLPNVQELLDNLVEDASRRLSEVKASLVTAAPGVPITTSVVAGWPSHAIADYARERGTDLIVIGSHGRTGLSHLLMGSVAERVSRTAPCPVLIVRETESSAKSETKNAAA